MDDNGECSIGEGIVRNASGKGSSSGHRLRSPTVALFHTRELGIRSSLGICSVSQVSRAMENVISGSTLQNRTLLERTPVCVRKVRVHRGTGMVHGRNGWTLDDAVSACRGLREIRGPAVVDLDLGERVGPAGAAAAGLAACRKMWRALMLAGRSPARLKG